MYDDYNKKVWIYKKQKMIKKQKNLKRLLKKTLSYPPTFIFRKMGK